MREGEGGRGRREGCRERKRKAILSLPPRAAQQHQGNQGRRRRREEERAKQAHARTQWIGRIEMGIGDGNGNTTLVALLLTERRGAARRVKDAANTSIVL